MKRSINSLESDNIVMQVTDAIVNEFSRPFVPPSPRNSTEYPVLKKSPYDFLVSESLVLPRCSNLNSAKFTYLKLTKLGFTTFEAINKIAQYFQLPPEQVLFAGLKDEDAITEQLIAVSIKVAHSSIEQFNCENAADPRGFIELQHYSTGDEPLVIGQLNGNSFRIVVRNLSLDFVKRFRSPFCHTFQFLNYYDTQRFGVAQQAKTSHLVGKALVADDYETAFELLKRAGTPESYKALASDATAKEFFASISPRVINFLKDSYSSYLWNENLSKVVSQVCGNEVYEEYCETIPFLFTWKQSLILALLKEQPSIEFKRFHGAANGDKGNSKLRATVTQTQIHLRCIGPDEAHPNAYKCELSFFLPSGCYATMCIRQLVNVVDLTL